MYRIELFGGLRVVKGEQTLTRFRTQKAAELLAYLAHFPRPHSRELLIDLLWPESGLDAGRNSLNVSVTSLSRQLEPPGVPKGGVLVRDRLRVGLNPDAFSSDTAEFEFLCRSARTEGADGRTLRQLADAVTLYRGVFLPGHYSDWVLREQTRLSEMFQDVLNCLVRALEGQGDLTGAINYARQAVGADPLNESFHRDLMRLFAKSGRPDAALRQFRELEGLLERELGEKPGAGLRAFARDIEAGTVTLTVPEPPVVAGDASYPPHAAPPDPSPPAEPPPKDKGHLPPAFTRFFGRGKELARLEAILSDPANRLVTLTGPGGSGKTRLSIETARLRADPLRGRAWFVGLQDLTDPAYIAGEIQAALALPRDTGFEPMEQVVRFLIEKPSLLVLDNLEQIVEGGAAVVRTLLERAESLQCLVTSRIRLNLEGEREYYVEPLPVPAGGETPESLTQYESVRLFVDRAQGARPDFGVTANNAPALAELCARLEGIPLALELVASRIGGMTPAQMLAQLGDRFGLAVSRRRDVSDRHRTLWDAVEWSYRLLTPELQRFFARLSVFRGGWTEEAASEVCEEPRAQEYLEELRECSLVRLSGEGGEARFTMLETLREYAGERLNREERKALRLRHLAYYVLRAEAAGQPASGVHQSHLIDRLEWDLDNCRLALETSLEWESPPESGLRIAGGLFGFHHVRGHNVEERDRYRRLLDRFEGTPPSPVFALALARYGCLERMVGDVGFVIPVLGKALEMARVLCDPPIIAHALCDLGLFFTTQGDLTRARRLLDEAIQIREQLGDQSGVSHHSAALASVATRQGDYDRAEDLYRRCLEINRQFGSTGKTNSADALTGLGVIALLRGDIQDAVTNYQGAHELYEELRNESGIALVYLYLAEANHLRRWWDVGQRYYSKSLSIWAKLNAREEAARSLQGLGRLYSDRGDTRLGIKLLSAAEKIHKSLSVPPPPPSYTWGLKETDRCLSRLRTRLGGAAFDQLWNAGQKLSWEEALRIALGEGSESDETGP